MEDLRQDHILIVDDIALNRELLGSALRRKGYRTFEATGGQEALQIVEQENIDLVLLDIMMPDMDGVSVLKELRKKYTSLDLPIIMVTAKSRDGDILNALSEDANDYLTKPLNLSIALARIRLILSWKKNHDEIQEAKEKADLASRAKSEFLSHMSHEIRTPMNSIIGMADLLHQSELSEDQKRYVETIVRASDGLLFLINNILDLSKIESGQMTVQEYEFDLLEMLEDVISITTPLAQKKGIYLCLSVEERLCKSYLGPKESIRQILLNLVGNAIKFTKKGGIYLNAKRSDDGMFFEVIDTGIGITEEKLTKIFESFTQGDPFITRNYGGTGLGLTISKKLVELMKGQIRVKSKVGKGSHFIVEVPLRPKGTGRRVFEGWSQMFSGKSALVYDTPPHRDKYIHQILKALEIDVTNVGDCYYCVDDLISKGKKFDYVLLNCERPFGKFALLSQKLGGLVEPGGIIFRVNETGPFKSSVELNDSQFVRVLLPVTRRSIIDSLCRFRKGREEANEIISKLNGGDGFASRSFENKATKPREKINPLGGVKILLADDSEDNRVLIKQFFKGFDVNLVEVENGQQAVDEFVKEKFNMVLMDIQMPILDGLSATKNIRDWEKGNGLRQTPILALSAHALTEEIKKSFEAGCDDHITKPIKRKPFLEIIHQYLKEETNLEKQKGI